MDSALAALLSWQLILFSLGIFFIVWFIRTIVEFFWKNTATNMVWTELVLRFLPCTLGGLIAFVATGYPYTTGIITASGRIFFGIVAGGVSGLLYGAIKAMAKGYIQNNTANTVSNTTINVNPQTQNTGLMSGNNPNLPPQ